MKNSWPGRRVAALLVRGSIAAGLLLTLAAVVYSQVPHGVRPAAARLGNPFAGKVIGVWCKNAERGGAISDVEIKEIGSRSFLVGKQIPAYRGDDAPYVGAAVFIPCDEVLQMIGFSNFAQAQKFFDSQPATEIRPVNELDRKANVSLPFPGVQPIVEPDRHSREKPRD